MPCHSVDTFYHLQQELVQRNPQSYSDYLITENKMKLKIIFLSAKCNFKETSNI